MNIKSHTVNEYTVTEYIGKQIYVINDLFSKEDCTEFINLINQLPKNNEYLKQGSNVQGYSNILQHQLAIDDSKYYQFDVGFKTVNIVNKLNGLSHYDIRKKIEKLNKKFKKLYDIISKINGGIQLQYNSNYIMRIITDATRLHIDGATAFKLNTNDKSYMLNEKLKYCENDIVNMNVNVVRELGTIIGLNGDYEGGELQFPEQDVSIKIKEGEIVCFPPYWTHPHKTTELLNNTKRYTITCWHG
jgi:hypothetical protein